MNTPDNTLAGYPIGRVLQEHLGRYSVSSGDTLINCSVSSKLRKVIEYSTADTSSIRKRVTAVRGIRSTSPVAVGDFVKFDDAGDGTGMIYQVVNRRNKLSRRAAGKRPLEQTLIANVDLAVLVFSIRKPDLNLQMLDRFLAICELQDISVLICVNKTDLVEPSITAPLVGLYEKIGYRILQISAKNGDGVDSVRASVQKMVAVFLGPSGTGKTTLLNTLEPGLGRRVKSVSRSTGRGRHTTTHSELYPLGRNSLLGDTPGLRDMSLWDVDVNQLHHLFPEMRPLIGSCRFRDCVHEEEPGCAVKAAVCSGQIDKSRHTSYRSIRQRP